MSSPEFNVHYIERRILETVGAMVRNGEITERTLARTSGISQPHLHQILKGTKRLSPRAADLLLARLEIGVLHLFETTDLDRHVSLLTGRAFAYVPVLEGRLGPGCPWPATTHRLERFPVPCKMLRPVGSPRVARLAADPEIEDCIEGHFALLDSVEEKPCPDAWYAVCLDGEGLIRRVRETGHTIQFGTGRDGEWRRVPGGAAEWRRSVRARIEFLGSAADLLVNGAAY